MRKYLFIGLLFIVGQIQSQELVFAEVGMEWFYDYYDAQESNQVDTSYNGFMRCFSEKDTLIEGKSCKKISRYATYFDLDSNKIISKQYPPVCIYLSNDSVWFFEAGQKIFSMVMDFSAKEEDVLYPPFCRPGCIQYDPNAIYNPRTQIFGGRSLYCYDLELWPTPYPSIIKGIGSTFGFLPWARTGPLCYPNEGRLRCVSSPNGFYQSFMPVGQRCDNIDKAIGIHESGPFPRGVLVNGRRGDKLILTSSYGFSKTLSLQLISTNGAIVASFNIQLLPGNNEVSMPIIPQGIYAVVATNTYFIGKLSW